MKRGIFGFDFYPTPTNVGEDMISGEDLQGKVVLEPSAGAGHLVAVLKGAGADVIACEIDADLRRILQTKCKVIGEDFLKITSDQVSHVDYIVMNPPFTYADEHILHAYDIAPPGCRIISLSNVQTVKNPYSERRSRLIEIINTHGQWSEMGKVFSNALRETEVEVALIRLQKPSENAEDEFSGFFIEEDAETQSVGLIQYNVVRELVNRYVGALKIFDRQLQTAVELEDMAGTFFNTASIGFRVTKGDAPFTRNDYKKELQKAGWLWIFAQFDLKKYVTKGVEEDINKFVEKQQDIPFTMRNIYHMLHIVVATAGQRMDKAMLEVFEDLTIHTHENRHNVEGWQTNSHYLINKRFILGNGSTQKLEDLVKALCYLTGRNYDHFIDYRQLLQYRYKLRDKDGNYIPKYSERSDIKICGHEYQLSELQEAQKKRPGSTIEDANLETTYGKWFDWTFFRVKRFMKGTIHCEFKDDQVWHLFNQRISKLKGYPLYEKKTQTKWQQQRDAKQSGKPAPKAKEHPKQKPVILSTIQL